MRSAAAGRPSPASAFLLGLAALFATFPGTARAATLIEAHVTCPIDGQEFLAETYGSYVTAGTRLDGMPVLVGTPSILPPPVCPGSGFVVYRDDFSEAETARLQTIVASPDLRAERDANTLHFPVAAYVAEVMGEPIVIVATLHVRATWESEVCDPSQYEALAATAVAWLDRLLGQSPPYEVRSGVLALIAANLERQIGRFEAAVARLASISAASIAGRPDLAAAIDLTRSLAAARDTDHWRMLPDS